MYIDLVYPKHVVIIIRKIYTASSLYTQSIFGVSYAKISRDLNQGCLFSCRSLIVPPILSALPCLDVLSSLPFLSFSILSHSSHCTHCSHFFNIEKEFIGICSGLHSAPQTFIKLQITTERKYKNFQQSTNSRIFRLVGIKKLGFLISLVFQKELQFQTCIIIIIFSSIYPIITCPNKFLIYVKKFFFFR